MPVTTSPLYPRPGAPPKRRLSGTDIIKEQTRRRLAAARAAAPEGAGESAPDDRSWPLYAPPPPPPPVPEAPASAEPAAAEAPAERWVYEGGAKNAHLERRPGAAYCGMKTSHMLPAPQGHGRQCKRCSAAAARNK